MEVIELIGKIEALDIKHRTIFIDKREGKIFSILKESKEGKSRSTLLEMVCEESINGKRFHKISHTYYHLLGSPTPEKLVGQFGNTVTLYFARAHFQTRRFSLSRKFYKYLLESDFSLEKKDKENLIFLENNKQLTSKAYFKKNLLSSFRDISVLIFSIFLIQEFPSSKVQILSICFGIIMFMNYFIDYRNSMHNR